MSAAPARTRPNPAVRATTSSASRPIGSPKTRTPARMDDMLAATEVTAITATRSDPGGLESHGRGGRAYSAERWASHGDVGLCGCVI